jgi:hypothetical protein
MLKILTALLTGCLLCLSTANAAPPHEPSIGQGPLNGWYMRAYEDSSVSHLPLTEYKMCFWYEGDRGSHERYRVYMYGGPPWESAKGIAVQEGDQVRIYADSESDRRLAAELQLVGSEGLHERPRGFGTGHLTLWGHDPSMFQYEFLNARFEAGGTCRCLDKACEKLDIAD